MGCFDNIVGVEGCENTESTSGLWLNGLNGIPGVTILTGAQVADQETQTGHRLLVACVQNASKRIITLALEEMSKYWLFGSIIRDYNYTNVGSYVDGVQTLELSLNTDCRKYTSFYIDTLTFLANDDITGASLYINGTLYTFDLARDVPYVLQVNESFTDDLSITMNENGISTGTSFFSGNIQQRCDKDLFFCQFKKELAEPIQFLSAHLFFQEATSSDRYNLATTMGLERYKEKEVLYWNMTLNSLKVSLSTIKNFLSNERCCCLKCNDTIYTHGLP